MSGWDQGQVYASNQGLVVGENAKKDVLLNDPSTARATFREFIRCHREGNVFRYRDQLLLNFRKREYALEVDLEDLNNFDSALKDVLQESPSVFLPIFEEAAADVIRRIGLQQVRAVECPCFVRACAFTCCLVPASMCAPLWSAFFVRTLNTCFCDCSVHTVEQQREQRR